VMDWGLAKILGREDSRDVRVRAEALMTSEVSSNRRDEVGVTPDSPLCTMDGDVVGTPAYMSPEQANGRVSEMGPPSDVYALGAMLYHLLAGHMPYVPRDARLNNYAVWSHVQSGPPRSLREIAPKAPPELVAICERAMERTSAERYPDMQALATDLRAYVENRVVRAYEAGAWAEARKWVRRNKLLAASMSAAVLLLVIGLTVALHLNRELEAESSKLVAEIGSVKRLSALQDFADLVQRADDLWPPFPENIERYEAWIGQARAIAADLPLHRERLAELRGRALDATDRELAEDRATHPDFARLRQLPGLIASQRSALLQRRDGIEAREYRLDRAALSEKAPALIVRAWSLVSPGRSVFGREAEGVGFARRALELATQAGSRESMASAGNALSRGLFAIGRDRDALAASRAALKAAIQPEQKRFAILLADLERWVATASSPAGLAHSAQQLAALEAEQKELESRVNARRTWNFPDTQQGRESRWWHTNLARLIEDLAGLTDERTGLLSEVADAASAKHGWSVPRRLAFARRLQAGLSAGSPWSERWREAATAIRRHDKYGGLELSPQVGLVPIGPDPLSGLWEFWNVTTGTEPVRAADGHLVLTEQTGAVLVLIPPGTFWMGSSVDPKDRNYVSASASDERPVHEVTMSAFFLSKYEMTQAQWAWFVGRNPSMHTPPSALAQSL
ncbi:MAG: SUMF1/EgtB/PvdO family nonheme iron enzyme, partial [Planctomycetes bacterium]|nr:SUMF1/EgtB/PvdO family nonheme iron enzyme [Planctomycetota bacterium]